MPPGIADCKADARGQKEVDHVKRVETQSIAKVTLGANRCCCVEFEKLFAHREAHAVICYLIFFFVPFVTSVVV
jgi:hypothetical protein